MALTARYKYLFCVILLKSIIVWDATAIKHHYQNQRLLPSENGAPVEEAVTDESRLDSDITLPSNITHVVKDHHVYYNSSFYSNPDVALFYWVDLKQFSSEGTITHRMLSESHRRAAGVTLSFDFPFYGHLMRNITIATGGFLYMGDYIHSWIAATQYIAPLMANFDPSLDESSTIQYYDNGTAFTVQWDNVILQDRRKDGSFTFQTTLLQNGDIIFVYKEIPISILEISNESHPVKVGCSDAYLMERTSIVFRKRIIYEYHRLDQKNQDISNNTVLYLTALPTCLKYQDCESCINADIGFNCTWCEAHGKCSDGLNRYRQEWLRLKCSEGNNNCPNVLNSTSATLAHNGTVIMQNISVRQIETTMPLVIMTTSMSSTDGNQSIEAITTTSNPILFSLSSSPDDRTTGNPFADSRKANQEEYIPKQGSGIGAGGIFVIVLIITLALGIGIWTFYAYKNPQSSSGQFLIKYRPSKWHLKNEESRYSASVHM